MSNQTYRQIHHKPLNTMILDSTAPEAGAFDGFPCDLGQDGALRGRGVVPDRDRGEEAFLLGRLPRGGILFTAVMRSAG